MEKKLKLLLLINLLIAGSYSAVTTEHLLTQNSTLTIKHLKKKNPKSFTKDTLITYKVQENFIKGTSEESPTLPTSLTSIYILERLQNLKSLRKFSISFTLGSFTSGYGSIFKAVFKNNKNKKTIEEEARELAFILGGWVGYSGITLFKRRKQFFSKDNEEGQGEVIYWDGLTTEVLCNHHFEKIKKILKPEKLSTIEYLFNNHILQESYARFELEFKFLPEKKDSTLTKNFNVVYSFEGIYPTRRLNKIFGSYFYTNLENSKIEIINEGEEKSFLSTITLTPKDSNKLSYSEIHKKGLKTLKGVKLSKKILDIHRKELGKTSTPGRKLHYWLKNNSKRKLETILSIPFSSYHNPWINSLKIRDLTNDKDINFEFDFKEFKDDKIGYVKKPVQFDVKFEIEGLSKVRLSVEYMQNFVDMNELDAEDERGVYLPSSLVFYRFLERGIDDEEDYDFGGQERECDFEGDYCIGEMENLLTRMSSYDITAVFTHLTLAVLFCGLYYSIFGAWGVGGNF